MALLETAGVLVNLTELITKKKKKKYCHKVSLSHSLSPCSVIEIYLDGMLLGLLQIKKQAIIATDNSLERVGDGKECDLAYIVASRILFACLLLFWSINMRISFSAFLPLRVIVRMR